MKRITCPRCNIKLKVLSAGNTDGATYIETRPRRTNRGMRHLRKMTNGSKYQFTLSCGCKTDKSRTLLTIIGRSKAHATTMLRLWRFREKVAIAMKDELVFTKEAVV